MRQAALYADFRGAELRGLNGFLRDLLRAQEVRVRLARAAAEGAELASDKTNVGEINITIHDVRDDIAGEFGPQQVGYRKHAKQIVAFGASQFVSVFPRDGIAVLTLENLLQRRANTRRDLRSNVRPIECRKIFQFHERKSAGHECLQMLLVFQITTRDCPFGERPSGISRWLRGEASLARSRGLFRSE